VKGNATVIERLNAMLAEELTAINQYMVHSEMCANWGYQHLHGENEKRAIEEMKHAEELIGRILFLEGRPVVDRLLALKIGSDVPAQLEFDRQLEEGAIRDYNASIRVAAELGDNGSRELLQDILEDEEVHIDDLEAQLEQIQQLGLPNYLLAQVS
jgi:bacterioferritin